jgi:Restriction Enzyme Adenine Methylase Associated
MLKSKNSIFIEASFSSEQELENVVLDNFEYLFGPNSFYIPKTLISTFEGSGTIPDGFAIDIEQKKWFLVEAELLRHRVWEHIAPQITKQTISIHNPAVIKIIEELAVKQIETDPRIKELFIEAGIREINFRREINEILSKDPIIGIPIDKISEDLKAWAKTFKYVINLWQVKKFIEFGNPENVIYEFPEEFKPEIETSEQISDNKEDKEKQLAQYDVEILDLIQAGYFKIGDELTMVYKPRTGERKIYKGVILEDGSISILGKTFSSPSFAALYGIQNAGSDRKTVNGWTSWKTLSGQTLAEIRDDFLSKE